MGQSSKKRCFGHGAPMPESSRVRHAAPPRSGFSLGGGSVSVVLEELIRTQVIGG